jgi:hypothetical protein
MRGMQVPYYRLYVLSNDNHIVEDREHSCDDNLAASGNRRELAKDHAIEIWESTRRVALVKAGDAALTAGGPSSLQP